MIKIVLLTNNYIGNCEFKNDEELHSFILTHKERETYTLENFVKAFNEGLISDENYIAIDPSSETLALINWPESQQCIGCDHSCFINSDDERIGDSAYLCHIGGPLTETCYTNEKE